FADMDHACKVITILTTKPFINPFESSFRKQGPVFSTDIDTKVIIIGKVDGGRLMQLFIFVTILIPKGRYIAQNCRRSRETACSLSVKKLLVGETAFYHHSIIFIAYKCQRILLPNKLR